MSLKPVSPEHNFIKKIKELQASGDFKPGINRCHINHDTWCNHLGGGICNCDPDITIIKAI